MLVEDLTPRTAFVAVTHRARRRGAVAPITALAVVTVVAALTGCAGSGSPAAPTSAPDTQSASTTTGPSGTAPSSPAPTSPASSAVGFPFQPLWPFGSVAEATAWQAKSGSGLQPWRMDAGQTALRFAASFLGYSEIDRVLSTRVSGSEAWVSVAGSPPEGRDRPAAVLHLARIGAGAPSTRPWEVVGSTDDILTLTTPRYGGVLLGPAITVGGTITGVDESLRIQVLDRAAGRLALRQGIPAGGEKQPWTASLAVDTSVARLVTIAVSTGGHVADVERFAVTAAQLRTDPGLPTYPTAHAAIASTVAKGTYIGACPKSGAANATQPVCSVALRRATGRHLYRVGFYQTDSGYYTLLTRDGKGRWIVAIRVLPGADVPPELGGPLG